MLLLTLIVVGRPFCWRFSGVFLDVSSVCRTKSFSCCLFVVLSGELVLQTLPQFVSWEWMHT